MPDGDALVTDQRGFSLAIVTADCAPVLLVDSHAGVIGAAHAGWRGAVGGVLEETIGAMEALGASRNAIAGAIGPCIAQASYEVDAPFRAHFSEADLRHFSAGDPDHWHFDLPGFVAARLIDAGVTQIDNLGIDTYSDEKRFHSYRRATHRGEASYGRQISLIGLSA